MSFIKIALILLLCISFAFGQQPISPEEFGKLFWKGWAGIGAAQKQGLRHIHTSEEWVLTVETDRKGSVRVRNVNAVTGVVDSECIIVGDSIYERLGNGPWRVRTRAEYFAETETARAALDKARAEKNYQEHERIRAAINIRATISAINSPNVMFFSSHTLMTPASPDITDRMMNATGKTKLKGQSVLTYKFKGTYNPPPNVRTIKNMYEVDYWFDEKTGMLLKALVKRDEVQVNSTITSIEKYEWEASPSITVTSPAIPQ